MYLSVAERQKVESRLRKETSHKKMTVDGRGAGEQNELRFHFLDFGNRIKH